MSADDNIGLILDPLSLSSASFSISTDNAFFIILFCISWKVNEWVCKVPNETWRKNVKPNLNLISDMTVYVRPGGNFWPYSVFDWAFD